MFVIRNKLNQRLIINLTGGRNIDLLAKGTADISDEDLSAPHLRALVEKGDSLVVQKLQTEEKKTEIMKTLDIEKKHTKKKTK